MQPADLVGPPGAGAKFGDAQRRSVRRNQAVRPNHRFDLGVGLLLELDVFDDRFDDQIAVLQVGVFGGPGQVGQRGCLGVFGDFAFRYAIREELLDSPETLLQHVLVEFADDRLESCRCRDLRDTRTHQSTTEQANRFDGHHTASMIIAIPWPPPIHADATPYFFCRRRNSSSNVSRSRAPLAPSGCPIAMAPPLTFTLSRSRPSSFSQARYCGAKASLISIRSRSANFRLARPSALRIAGAGPMPINVGSTPTVAHDTMRPSGFSPLSFTAFAPAITRAAAPSTMPLALPAVTTPSFLNTVGSLASTSIVVSGRM